MSDPWDRLSGLLTRIAKGTEAPSRARMISDLVKEEMTYWAEIDEGASFEWTREDISNYTPDDVVALLDEIEKIWADDMLSWIEYKVSARDHSEDGHDLRWNE